MKFEKLSCPSCGAGIEMDIKGRKSLFCPFCGSQFSVDDGEKTYTHNFNIHERYTDDAAIEKEKIKDRENERNHKESKWMMIGLVLIFMIDVVFLAFLWMKDEWDEKKAISEGKIRVGIASEDLEGKKYQGIEEQLKVSGFTNIVTVDLDDAGLFTNRVDTIANISINGDSSFSDSEYFDPDSRIVISYH